VSEKNPNAFPAMERFDKYDEDRGKYVEHHLPEGGMSLRDYFAAKALQGLLAHPCPDDKRLHPGLGMAARAYEYADAMLKARVAK
jgi:hypothetical protein